MGTDYTTTITAVIGLVVLLTAMTAFVLTRPSDLPSSSR